MRFRILITALILTAIAGTMTWAVGTRAATGTFAAGQPGLLSFSGEVSNVIFLNNRSPKVAYFKLYRNYSASSDTTVSATTYDVAIETSQSLVISREALRYFPVTAVGVYGESTSSTQVRVTGL